MRKLLTFIIAGFLLVLIFNSVKASFESYQKLEELGGGKDQLNNLQVKNKQLKQELTNKQTDFFVEQEARNRLGLQKTGDTIIILQDQSSNSIEKKVNQTQESNLQKWLKLLKI